MIFSFALYNLEFSYIILKYNNIFLKYYSLNLNLYIHKGLSLMPFSIIKKTIMCIEVQREKMTVELRGMKL